jgi:hypothetical protein
MSLGSYPQISLKEARRRRDEARALVAQGINPYEHRKQQRRSVRNAAEHTFEAVFDQWVAEPEGGAPEHPLADLENLQKRRPANARKTCGWTAADAADHRLTPFVKI